MIPKIKVSLPFGPPMHMCLFPGDLEDLMTKYGFEKTNLVDFEHNYVIEFSRMLYSSFSSCSDAFNNMALMPTMGKKEIPAAGIFSTCNPALPDPILMTIVRLCRRNENVLEAEGLDVTNGSTVVDIQNLMLRTLIPKWAIAIFQMDGTTPK